MLIAICSCKLKRLSIALRQVPERGINKELISLLLLRDTNDESLRPESPRYHGLALSCARAGVDFQRGFIKIPYLMSALWLCALLLAGLSDIPSHQSVIENHQLVGEPLEQYPLLQTVSRIVSKWHTGPQIQVWSSDSWTTAHLPMDFVCVLVNCCLSRRDRSTIRLLDYSRSYWIFEGRLFLGAFDLCVQQIASVGLFATNKVRRFYWR